MRARPTIAILAIPAIVAVVGLGGCGGSSDDGVQPTRPYADANRICLEVAKRFADLQKDSPRSFEQGEQLLTALTQTAKDGESALEQVVPPPLQAPAFERYLESRQRVGDLLARGIQAAKDEKGKSYERLRVAANSGSDQRRHMAAEAGLEDCAATEHG